MQGFIASGVAFAVQIWCIDRGGPVFVAVYQPVQTLVVAIMASIALGEQFYLGGYLHLMIKASYQCDACSYIWYLEAYLIQSIYHAGSLVQY